MTPERLPVKKTESIFDEMEKMHDRIIRRAYEIFDGNGRFFGRDLDDWLKAEQELSWKPTIELREKDNEFLIDIAVPGIEAKDLHIEVTPEELLVRGESYHDHNEEKGTIHWCEFQSGSLFRTLRFPRRIEPDKVKAEFRNGVLHLKAPVAEALVPTKVKVQTA